MTLEPSMVRNEKDEDTLQFRQISVELINPAVKYYYHTTIKHEHFQKI